MLRIWFVGLSLVFSTNAHGTENAFNADTSIPIIKSVITEFEKICFPFIVHQTELTDEQNRTVFKSKLIQAGYKFEEEKSWSEDKPLNKHSYAPSICPKGSIPESTPRRVEGDYTIFPNSGRFLDESNITVKSPMCEIMMSHRTPMRITEFTRQRFRHITDSNISTYLTWQNVPDYLQAIITANKNAFTYNSYKEFKVRTKFPPAYSCIITASDSRLTLKEVETAFIGKDPDWKAQKVTKENSKEILPDIRHWTQCTHQDGQNYIYNVNFGRDALSISVEALQDDEFAESYDCKSALEKG